MVLAGVGVPLLLLLVVGNLICQHAVQGDDDVLKLRAFKAAKPTEAYKSKAFTDLSNIIAGSDVTALMWTNPGISANDTIFLRDRVNNQGFSYSVETCKNPLYSFYYNSTMFSSANSTYDSDVEKLCVTDFEFATFDGGPLTLAAHSLEPGEISNNRIHSHHERINSFIAKYEGYPLGLLGNFGKTIQKRIIRSFNRQTYYEVYNVNTSNPSRFTKPTLLLNGMARSMITMEKPEQNMLKKQYFPRLPMYATLNLTKLKNELLAFKEKPQPAKHYQHQYQYQHQHQQQHHHQHRHQRQRQHTNTAINGIPQSSLQKSAPEPSGWHHQPVSSPASGRPLQILPAQLSEMASSGQTYAYSTSRPSPFAGVNPVPGRSSAAIRTGPHRRFPHGPYSRERSPEKTLSSQVHGPLTNDRTTFTCWDLIGGTTGYSSPNHYGVYGEDMLRIGASVVPAYTNYESSMLNALFYLVSCLDIAVLMWTDSKETQYSTQVCNELNRYGPRSYSVAFTEFGYSFLYNKELFRGVKIERIKDPKSVLVLCIATFEWVDDQGVPFSVVINYPITKTDGFALSNLHFRERYGNESLVLLGNFPNENISPLTKPILFLNSMKTSLIDFFYPQLTEKLLYYLQHPPLCLHFNLAQLRNRLALPRVLQQDEEGISRRPTPTAMDVDYARAEHFRDAAVSTQGNFSPRQSPQPPSLSSTGANPDGGWRMVGSTSAGSKSSTAGATLPLPPVQDERRPRNPRKEMLQRATQYIDQVPFHPQY